MAPVWMLKGGFPDRVQISLPKCKSWPDDSTNLSIIKSSMLEWKPPSGLNRKFFQDYPLQWALAAWLLRWRAIFHERRRPVVRTGERADRSWRSSNWDESCEGLRRGGSSRSGWPGEKPEERVSFSDMTKFEGGNKASETKTSKPSDLETKET